MRERLPQAITGVMCSDSVCLCWMSAVEHRPADAVAQPLIIKHEVADSRRELLALPLALEPSGLLSGTSWRGGAHGLDRVGGCTKLVGGDMGDRRSLSRSVGGIARRPAQIAGGGISVASGCPRLRHRDRAAHPGARLLKRIARALVSRSNGLEEMQDMLGACGGPHGKQVMIGISQRPAAADRDKAWIANVRQNHGGTILCGICPALCFRCA